MNSGVEEVRTETVSAECGWRETLMAECEEVQARIRRQVDADCVEDWL